MPGNPDIAVTIPAVIARHPDPAFVRAWTRMFNERRWRADLDINMLRKRGGDRRDAEDCSRSDEKEFFHRSGSSFLEKVGAAGGFLTAAQPMEPERGPPGCEEIFSQKTLLMVCAG